MMNFARRRFMIGQYGTFDFRKYARDFKTGFRGIEACLFQREEDVVLLQKEAAVSDFRVGIHFPLRAGRSEVRDALFLSGKRQVRDEAYKLAEQELRDVKGMNPAYILFHYPKPVILDEAVDWSKWRFACEAEYVYEQLYPLSELEKRSRELFAWLQEQSERYRFTPILEFDGLNRYIYEESFLIDLLKQYPKVRLCLDTARLFLQERLDPRFNAKSLLQRYAPYADLVHLSNLQLDDENTTVRSRVPVLPTQSPKDGWAPIKEYLSIILSQSPNVNIMFEHRSDLVGDEELEACYAWVEELIEQAMLTRS